MQLQTNEKTNYTNNIPKSNNQMISEDSHVFQLWQPLKFEIDENFQFIRHGILFKLFSSIFHLIAYPILLIFNKVFFGFKIEGKENLTKVTGGKITVSNHVHCLDCTMIGISNFPSKTYYTSLETNFKIPIVKNLITLFNAIPIPKSKKYTPNFINAIDKEAEEIVNLVKEGQRKIY